MNSVFYFLPLFIMLCACNSFFLKPQTKSLQASVPPRPLRGIKVFPKTIPIEIQDEIISIDQYGNRRLQLKLFTVSTSWENLKYSLAHFLEVYQASYQIIWADVQVNKHPHSYFQVEWFAFSVPQYQRYSIIQGPYENFRNITFTLPKL